MSKPPGPGAPPPQMSVPAPGPPMVPPVLRAVVNEVNFVISFRYWERSTVTTHESGACW